MGNQKTQTDKDRHKTRIAVYLIGIRGETILLAKRQNTGHMDGCWSLVAGHVREGESSTHALIREVQEECGLHLNADEVTLVGAMHHYSPPFDYIQIAFLADLNAKEPQNLEPYKCEQLAFHPLDKLPNPMEEYIVTIIKQSVSGNLWVSEYGWGA